MDLKAVRLEIPEGANVVVGQAHFMKTVEDLYEAMVSSAPTIKFGLAFCEASQERLVRSEGNDPELQEAAIRNALEIGAGHSFVILMKGAYPINVMGAVRSCPEVCRVFCATANPMEVIVAVTDQGRGVLGVVDGFSPAGAENSEQKAHRRDFLRTIGYKLR
jgi:adenosine/AMP kinase